MYSVSWPFASNQFGGVHAEQLTWSVCAEAWRSRGLKYFVSSLLGNKLVSFFFFFPFFRSSVEVMKAVWYIMKVAFDQKNLEHSKPHAFLRAKGVLTPLELAVVSCALMQAFWKIGTERALMHVAVSIYIQGCLYTGRTARVLLYHFCPCGIRQVIA